MAGLNLPTLVHAQGRRTDVTLRPITPTQAQATDLAAIYAPAWRIWQDNIERILTGYDRAPLADHLTRDDTSAMQSAIDATASEFMTRLVAVITPSLRQWAVRAESIHRSKWAAAVRAGTGIDLSMILTAQPVAETLEVWVARNVALAKNISDQAQARISDAVFRGYDNRTPTREVAKEIREATGVGALRARNIAADQSSKLSAALDMERQAEAGIEQYRWRHSGKLHPRAEHRARDGDLYKLGLPDGDTPGQAPFCGCRAAAYIPLMDEIE